jgi:uncharacterized protein YijF (DUF1287 family)
MPLHPSIIALLLLATSCFDRPTPRGSLVGFIATAVEADSLPAPSPYGARLAAAALELTRDNVVYDPAYFRIPYPNGDVPAGKGVCTDVVIRTYRRLGADLQRLVHEDMARNFEAYPRTWGLKKPDPNIDHRRVANLRTFFTRQAAQLPVTAEARDYRPGDVVTWDLGRGLAHIGIVADRRAEDGKRYLIVHNIGAGQVVEDFLFRYTITGHYRYCPQ